MKLSESLRVNVTFYKRNAEFSTIIVILDPNSILKPFSKINGFTAWQPPRCSLQGWPPPKSHNAIRHPALDRPLNGTWNCWMGTGEYDMFAVTLPCKYMKILVVWNTEVYFWWFWNLDEFCLKQVSDELPNKSVTKNNSWIVENKMSTSEYQHQQMVSNIFCSLTLEALVALFHLLPARTVGRLLHNFGLNLKFIRAVGFLVFVVNKDRDKHLIKQNKNNFLGEKNTCCHFLALHPTKCQGISTCRLPSKHLATSPEPSPWLQQPFWENNETHHF